MLLINRCIIILVVIYSMGYGLLECLMALSGTLIAEFIPYLSIWIVISVFGMFWSPILPFSLGGLLFIVAELTTLNGVEVLPFFGKSRVHILKGSHRKGEFLEYFFVTLIVIAALVLPRNANKSVESENFEPYLYDWKRLYNDGLIDPREWKEHRFDYF